jgi:hypothetical protein
MTKYLGDLKAGSTINFKWNTTDSTGASVNPTVNGTLYVYKDDSTTTEVTTGITDSRGFDSLVGVHHCKIVLTDAFYAAGHDYQVVLKAATIDGKTVNCSIAEFSIENRSHKHMAEDAIDGKFNLASGVVDADIIKISTSAPAADALELLALTAKGTDHKILISTDNQDLATTLHVNAKAIAGAAVQAANLMAWATAGVGISSTDGKTIISADVQDLAATFKVDAKRISDSAAAADAVEANIGNLNAQVSTRALEDGGRLADVQTKVGTPISLDSGTATLAGMLTKMADDNGGAEFDATDHSLYAVGEATGGGGVADWTSSEKKQIRYRLGMDGDKQEPGDDDSYPRTDKGVGTGPSRI